MKKLHITLLLIGLSMVGLAQVNTNAIGLRLGGNGDVNGAEISYQIGMSSQNRIELDLGFGTGNGHNRMYLAGIYHWDWNITDALN